MSISRRPKDVDLRPKKRAPTNDNDIDYDRPSKRRAFSDHNDRPSLVPKLSVPLHVDDLREWHRRILLNLCRIVVKDGVPQLNEKIFYFYSPTLGSLGLRVGCCDCISMTKSVSGDSLLYDENGKAHQFQHGAANVDGCATLVCQYRYFASDGPSDLATRGCQPPSQSNSISFGTNLITESSIDDMVSQNVFRIVDSTPQKVALLRLLVSAGLEIFKVPLDNVRLQQAIDASLPNEFFIDRFSSNPIRIPIWYSGGPRHSVRVLKILYAQYEFRRYFEILSQIYPGGVIGGAFCPIYDYSILSLPPIDKVRKPTLPIPVKRELATSKLKHYRRIISETKRRRTLKPPSRTSLSLAIERYYTTKIKRVISKKSRVYSSNGTRIRFTL
eukprot:scaffold59816_cov55-Cyclotella_meneghiniana.AAC.2